MTSDVATIGYTNWLRLFRNSGEVISRHWRENFFDEICRSDLPLRVDKIQAWMTSVARTHSSQTDLQSDFPFAFCATKYSVETSVWQKIKVSGGPLMRCSGDIRMFAVRKHLEHSIQRWSWSFVRGLFDPAPVAIRDYARKPRDAWRTSYLGNRCYNQPYNDFWVFFNSIWSEQGGKSVTVDHFLDGNRNPRKTHTWNFAHNHLIFWLQ